MEDGPLSFKLPLESSGKAKASKARCQRDGGGGGGLGFRVWGLGFRV